MSYDDNILNIKKLVENKKNKEKREEVEKTEKTLIQKAVKKNFQEFLDQGIDPLIDNHDIKGESVVLRIFDYRPKKEDGIVSSTLSLDLNGRTNLDSRYRTFPIGKILAAGDKSTYKKGDIVKLKDFEAGTIDNPRYEMWTNNPHNRSNMNKVGQEPPSTINNLMSIFKAKMFVINPLKLELDDDDYMTFKLFDANIENGIKDPLKFIECL